MELVKSWKINGQSLKDAMKESLSAGFEGLIVKRTTSAYIPAGRTRDWVKLKPDYLDSLALEVDLLIIGADPGRMKSTSSLNLSSFTCAVQEAPGLWCIITRVGSGYSSEELGELAEEIEPLLEPFDKNRPYPWLCEQVATGLRPKYIVKDPYKSIVIQVRAHGLVTSEMYPHGRALRFPRFMRRRPDRSAADCTSRAEIDSWKLPEISFERFLNEEHHNASSKRGSSLAKRRRIKAAPSTTWSKALASDKGIFKDLSFYVPYGSTTASKVELEEKISSQAGSVTQNPKDLITIVVTGQSSGVRLKNLEKSGNFAVFESKWLDECLANDRLVDPTPFKIGAGSVPEGLQKALAAQSNDDGEGHGSREDRANSTSTPDYADTQLEFSSADATTDDE